MTNLLIAIIMGSESDLPIMREAVERIKFEGMHYRRDIGKRALQ